MVIGMHNTQLLNNRTRYYKLIKIISYLDAMEFRI